MMMMAGTANCSSTSTTTNLEKCVGPGPISPSFRVCATPTQVKSAYGSTVTRPSTNSSGSSSNGPDLAVSSCVNVAKSCVIVEPLTAPSTQHIFHHHNLVSSSSLIFPNQSTRHSAIATTLVDSTSSIATNAPSIDIHSDLTGHSHRSSQEPDLIESASLPGM